MNRARPCFSLSVAFLVAALSMQSGCGGSAVDERPDVVLILIDTLRPDHLGFQGYEEDTAPFLASLAQEATVFTEAHSTSSWTAPSTASVFTGLYPTDHGVTMGFFTHKKLAEQVAAGGSAELSLNRMTSSVQTLPERFQAAGYRTFGLAGNVNIGPEIGFDRGFDHFERLRPTDRKASPSAEVLIDALDEWEPELQGPGPNFIYLHFMDPHVPYNKREPWFAGNSERVENQLEAAYDSEISYLDLALEQLFAARGWGADAIVMIVSDHGEEFMEHGRIGHQESLYRELVHVLAMVHAPVADVPAALVESNVSLIDVLPTLCSLGGVSVDEELPGLNLTPLFAEGAGAAKLRATLDERLIFAHRRVVPTSTGADGGLWAVMQGDWKYIRARKGARLYQRNVDPMEQKDCLSEHAALGQRLGETLDHFAAAASWGSGERTLLKMDKETLETLRQLGYAE